MPDWREAVRPSYDETLRAVLRGDEDAFVKFCVDVLPELLKQQERRCRKWKLPTDVAEDIVNEAIRRAVVWTRKHEEKIEQPTHFINKILKQITFTTKAQYAKHRHVEILDHHLQATDDLVALRMDVEEAFDRLQPAETEILKLILEQGHTPTNAAKILGIQKWTAYKRYERALVKIRSVLES